MTSLLQDLYHDSALGEEPVFSSPFGAPAGSAAGLELEDKDDISGGELVNGSHTELPDTN